MHRRRRRGPPALSPALGGIILALALLGHAGIARAADGGTSPVPIGEIAVRAEEAQAALRRLQSAAVTPPDILAIEQQLAGAQDRVTRGLAYTDWLLESRPSFPTLERLAAPWERMRQRLNDWNATLTKRAGEMQEALDRLDALRERWTATRAEARQAATPAPVVERIDGLIAAIGQAQRLLRTQRSSVVLLQDRVAAEAGRCDQVLARLEQLRRELVVGVLDRQGEPIWGRTFPAGWWPATRQALADTLPLVLRGARRVTLEAPGVTALSVLGLAVLLALLWRAERDPAVRAALGTQAGRAPSLARALAGAWLLVMLVVWLTAVGSVSPVDLREIALVIPVSLLLSLELPRRWRPLLYAFGGLYIIDRLRNALWRQPLAEQGLLVVETLAAIGLAVWFLAAWRRAAAEAPPTPLGAFLDVAARAALLAWIVALGAGAAGYVSLASLLGGGAVSSAYLALAFHGVVLVAERLAALALGAWPITRLRAVQRRPALVLRKVRALLGWLGIAAWIWVTLESQGLLESSLGAARTVLAARLSWGAIGISLGDVIAFGLTVWAAFLVSGLARFFLEEDVFETMGLKRGVPFALSRLLHYGILLIGFTVAVGALGVDLNKLTVLAGAFGVGVGFGLQNVVSNFVSGLILLMERPIRVGDAVQMGDLAGEVRQIGMRSSIVRTWDGAEVIVPNTQMVSEKVVNWTLSDRRRRVVLRVGVAYGSDPERVIELLRGVALQHPRALRQPEPGAIFRGFGESSLDFEVWAWTDRFEDAVALQSDLGVAVNSALRAAKIEVAFPQRVIHVRGEEPLPPGSS